MRISPDRDGRPCIVVIEHERGVSDALSIAFRRHWPQAAVLLASDAETGVRLALERTPDVVLLDADLPADSAQDVLDGIRGRSSVPVVLLGGRTASAEVDLELAKPFSTRVLLQFIETRLRTPPETVDQDRPAVLERTARAASAVLAAALVVLSAGQPWPYNGADRDLVCDLPADQASDQFQAVRWRRSSTG